MDKAIQSRFESGSKKELNIEGSRKQSLIDLQRFTRTCDVGLDQIFTVVRGCRPFEDKVSLTRQLNGILDRFRGQAGAQDGAKLAPRGLDNRSEVDFLTFGS